MGKSVLDMSVSLDGFVCGPNETPENGLGDNGMRLHRWIGFDPEVDPGKDSWHADGVNGEMMSALMATGAVVAGRGTVEPAGWWDGDHHDGVAIFILSRTKTPDDVAQWRRWRRACWMKCSSISFPPFSAEVADSSKGSTPAGPTISS